MPTSCKKAQNSWWKPVEQKKKETYGVICSRKRVSHFVSSGFQPLFLLLSAKGQGVTREMGLGQSVSVRWATVSAAVMEKLTCWARKDRTGGRQPAHVIFYSCPCVKWSHCTAIENQLPLLSIYDPSTYQNILVVFNYLFYIYWPNFMTRNIKSTEKMPRLMRLSWWMSSAFFHCCYPGIGCQCTLGCTWYTVCAASWGNKAICDMLSQHILTTPVQLRWWPWSMIFTLTDHHCMSTCIGRSKMQALIYVFH